MAASLGSMAGAQSHMAPTTAMALDSTLATLSFMDFTRALVSVRQASEEQPCSHAATFAVPAYV